MYFNYGRANERNFLIDEYALSNKVLVESPHFIAPQILILKGEFDKVC